MNQPHPQRPTRSSATLAIGGPALLVILGALCTAGCGASQPLAAAAPPGSAPTLTAAATPTSPDQGPSASSAARRRTTTAPTTEDPASDRQLCQAITINLSFITKAAESPDDPSLEAGIAKIRHLADIAPVEIKHDLTVIADFDQHILDQVRAGRRPEIKESPELTAALSHEARWAAEHC